MKKSDKSENTRSVVTFYHEAFDESTSCPIKQEVDLLDYEVLIESYKILAKNHRKHQQKRLDQIKELRHRRLLNRNEDRENIVPPTNRCNKKGDFVTNKHKQAILTLVEVDCSTKRVVRIRPEFFPSNTKVLPACLVRLQALKSLVLDHCKELSCFPAGVWFPQLEELAIDVTGFKKPFSASFGNQTKLRKLIVRGNCTSLEHWSRYKGSEESHDSRDDDITEDTSHLLFPPSMAKLTNLNHLETHVRNLLQIPSSVLEVWSFSLETLVTTQDLVATPNQNNSKNSNHSNESNSFLPRIRSFSESTNDSSDDSFDHLIDSSDDDFDTSDDDCGFSVLKHSSLFRKALESQLEVRAFSAIAKFNNLCSLKLLFDDSKHKQDIRNRLRRKNATDETAPYCVPLSLLAGALSMSLQQLDIGTCIASTTPSSSRKKSKIPIEIAWVDILQTFPMLQSLRLQDCRASFSSKTQNVDPLDGRTKVLWMPELKHLVLDRCPDFALLPDSIGDSGPRQKLSPASSFQDDMEFIDEQDIDDDDDDDDDDETEEIVFLPLSEETSVEKDKSPTNNDVYFEPLNDEDVNTMVEEDPEEISRIIRLSGLLNTVLSPKEKEQADTAETQKLSNLCTHFLKHCPNLKIVSLRDCKIPYFCQELLDCLPKDSLCELTLDILECERYESKSNNDHLWDIVEAFPNLAGLQGTCLDGISESEFKALHRFLCKRQSKQRSNSSGNNKRRPNSPLQHWRPFWDKDCDSSEKPLPWTSAKHQDAAPTSQNPFNLPGAIEQKLFFLDRILHRKTPGGRMLHPVRRSNSRDVL